MNTYHNLIERKFNTPLGTVCCGIISGSAQNEFIGTKNYRNGQSETFLVNGYKIELVTFKVKTPLRNGETVIDSCGWIWRIEKISDINEDLEIFCLLETDIENIEFDIATGEHLDAIEVCDSNWILNIGTEDGEILKSRATQNDWFPQRLSNSIAQYLSQMKKNGFKTKIPHLINQEKLYIQYLTAYNKYSSKKVSTWIAVDESKRNLENWIGLNN